MKVSYPGENVGAGAADSTIHSVLGEVKRGTYDAAAFWPLHIVSPGKDAEGKKLPSLVEQLVALKFFKREDASAKVDFPAPPAAAPAAIATPATEVAEAPAAAEESTPASGKRAAGK